MADLATGVSAEMQPNPGVALRSRGGARLDGVAALEVPEDALPQVSSHRRIGNGVVIRDDGLVLTIGYLITKRPPFG